MKEVIRVNFDSNKEETPVEFTDYLDSDNGWENFDEAVHSVPKDFTQIVYLGHCSSDGDMFAAYGEMGYILIFKGHLNSGKY